MLPKPCIITMLGGSLSEIRGTRAVTKGAMTGRCRLRHWVGVGHLLHVGVVGHSAPSSLEVDTLTVHDYVVTTDSTEKPAEGGQAGQPGSSHRTNGLSESAVGSGTSVMPWHPYYSHTPAGTGRSAGGEEDQGFRQGSLQDPSSKKQAPPCAFGRGQCARAVSYNPAELIAGTRTSRRFAEGDPCLGSSLGPIRKRQ